MIFLVGETAAARELGEELLALGIPSLKIETYNDRFRLLASQTKRDGDMAELLSWITSFACTAVLDASHPSCSVKFGVLREYCENQGIPFLRLERSETVIPANPLIHTTGNWEQALAKLGERVLTLSRTGRERISLSEAGKDPVTVFVTTGSHQLDSLIHSPFAPQARFVVRVLPEGRLVQKCQDLGIPPRDIVAMQGPFSKELNRMLFKFYGTNIVFTRDSGPAGGTDTKISAALALGLEVVVLKRAVTKQGLTVHSVKDVLAWVKENVR